MFHRRLALLALAGVASMAPLVVQMGRLTIAQGAELREEAESALVARSWTPAPRGQILDRKGRVLAKDRPSYDIAVDYGIVAGGQAWAQTRAARIARDHYRGQWSEFSPEERRAKIDAYMPAVVAHLEASWARLSQLTGQTPEQLEERRAEIRKDVDRRFQHVTGRRLTQELQAQLALGREITAETEAEIQRRATRDIEEQRSPHVVAPKVADEVAFELQRLSDQRVQIVVPTPDGGSELWPPPQRLAMLGLPVLPGVRVIASGDREYPLDTLAVDVNAATLPSPVRRAGTVRINVEGVAYHVLGRMRLRATAEDNQRRRERIEREPTFAERVRTATDVPGLNERLDRGFYDDTDAAGLGGMEEAQEDVLRGLRGLVVEQRETGERFQIDATPGSDVRLTIDAMLQARVMAAMSPELGLAVAQKWHLGTGRENPTVPVGTPLPGAAVVLDIDSGEVLAMVSTPSISRRQLRESPEKVFEDPLNRELSMPWVDRSISRPYPPGSIAKALTLNTAVMLGRHDVSQPIACTGHLYPDKPDMFRCWIFKQHNITHDAYFGHSPNAEESLMVSCNIYYFTLGQRLGPEGILRNYRQFGLGSPLHLGLERPGQDFVEFPGYLGLTADGAPASATQPGNVSPSDAIQMAIGQGPVAWTPLHAADAYATIARGGVRVRPHLIAAAGSPETENLGLDPRAVASAMEGLRLSIMDERGTGHHITLEGGIKEVHFNAPGVQIWGKTGTATAPTILAPRSAQPGDVFWEQSVDPAGMGAFADVMGLRAPAGRRVLRWGDHSWFVVLVGRAGENRPRVVISVLMEYAGSGGKVSGPIVNQIIHALQAEGYL